MSSTKNVLDFGLTFLSKTCLWGLIKMSLFGVLFLYQFRIKFGCILTALTPKIHQKWGVTLDTMENGHWPKGFSLKILRNSWYRPLAIIEPMLQDRFLIDFEASKTSPRRLKTPQDGSKTWPSANSSHFTLHSSQFAANTKQTCYSVNNVAFVPMQAYYILTTGLLTPALLTHIERLEHSNAQTMSLCNHGWVQTAGSTRS